MVWDVEAIKSAVVAAIVTFAGSTVFYQIVKIGIKKLVEKLISSVDKLKEERILTDKQHDDAITEIMKRETQLTNKVGEVLDKLPEADAINRIDQYWQGVADKIDNFLSEVADE